MLEHMGGAALILPSAAPRPAPDAITALDAVTAPPCLSASALLPHVHPQAASTLTAPPASCPLPLPFLALLGRLCRLGRGTVTPWGYLFLCVWGDPSLFP